MISRFQLRCMCLAASAGPLFPAMELGQNVPSDLSYATLRVFNNRIVSAGFYTDISATTQLPLSSQDATTGLPTTAFAAKLSQGPLSADPSVTGNWCLIYSAPAQRNASVTSGTGISLVSSTYSGGVGKVIVSYTQNSSALVIGLDGGVTALAAYDPTSYAVWSTGATPALASDQWLATTPQWAYLRMMDSALINQDFVANNSWPDVINWSDRRTASNFYLDCGTGAKGGMPLEFQVGLCNAAGKSGWFTLPENGSDDYITQYATYVANNLTAGLTATFEHANERWNTSGGFWNYRKAGYAGQTECVAFKSAATTDWIRTYMGGAYVSTFQSNGTTATVVFAGGTGHGQTVGTSTLVPKIQTTVSAYSNFNATGPMTVVDAFTITYPTTQASTSGTVAATTVLGSSDFLALNGAAGLLTGGFISSVFRFSNFWHYRRVMQMAKLVKDAFVSAGRQVSDCMPVLALQAGAGDSAQYGFGTKSITNFLAAQFPGVKMSDRLKAVAWGGYLQLDQGGSITNSGFGLIGTRFQPTDVASTVSQLQALANVGYGAYSYSACLAWTQAQGLEAWIYEVGLDTYGAGGQSTTTQNAVNAANADPTIAAPITMWLYNYNAMGVKRAGWYQCGTGSYSLQGCFNLGQTAAEVTASTPAASQSPKYKGVMASKVAWATPQPRHAVPCTISGWDMVGNEAVVVNGSLWPSLTGTNLVTSSNYTYQGPNGNGETYYVWLESTTAQSVAVTIVGDYTTAGATTISVGPLNGAGTGGSSFALSGVKSNTVLGTCSITLQPGANYVFISASANAGNVFPRSIQFA